MRNRGALWEIGWECCPLTGLFKLAPRQGVASTSQSPQGLSLAVGKSVSPGVRSGGQGRGDLRVLEVAQCKGGAEGLFTHP